jgi:biopolymer transport protein ExbD
MGLKSRTKISAEFNMSSLTDIIFLLLIFFMLTSNMVNINIPLPKSDSKTVAPSDLSVMVKLDGSVSFNGKPTNWDELEQVIATNVRYTDNKESAVLTIITEAGVTYEEMHKVMKLAASLKLKAILATEPTKK